MRKGPPRFIEKVKEDTIYSVYEYIDYVCSWEALIVGYTHPKVVELFKL